jgi:hypothetical protein
MMACPKCGKEYPHLTPMPYAQTCSACDFKVRLVPTGLDAKGHHPGKPHSQGEER